MQIDGNHDFIQLIFPTNKPSRNSFHGYYLDNELLIEQLRNNAVVKENLMKSAAVLVFSAAINLGPSAMILINLESSSD